MSSSRRSEDGLSQTKVNLVKKRFALRRNRFKTCTERGPMKMPFLPIRSRLFARASSSPAERVTIGAYRYIRICLAVAVGALLTQPALVSAQTATTSAKDG